VVFVNAQLWDGPPILPEGTNYDQEISLVLDGEPALDGCTVGHGVVCHRSIWRPDRPDGCHRLEFRRRDQVIALNRSPRTFAFSAPTDGEAVPMSNTLEVTWEPPVPDASLLEIGMGTSGSDGCDGRYVVDKKGASSVTFALQPPPAGVDPATCTGSLYWEYRGEREPLPGLPHVHLQRPAQLARHFRLVAR
jgi:hypothetical protein